ncbi:PKD domain-containing protein [Kitasatospora sp. NBC_00315]|uniref:PKD domain-containing protein n=1 Tax=Kitasatospora sp. NBC_00315 TaxID=2975963 RepID=UPI00324BCBE6
MRFNRLAGLTGATVLALGLGLPIPAATAATADVSTLFVDNSIPSRCSDSGSGTQAAPFCSISAAAAAAQPGQTVEVAYGWGGDYGPAQITRSGEPGRPITFTTGPAYPHTAEVASHPNAPAFTFSGVHDIVVQNFDVFADGQAFLVKDSSRVRIEHTALVQTITPSSLVQLTGATQDVTLTRNDLATSGTGGIRIGAGVRGTTLTRNQIGGTDPQQFLATDAPGTVVTGNTIVQQCGTPVRLTGASSGSAVHNNIVVNNDRTPTCAAGAPLVSVSAASAPGTTLDHNLLGPVDASAPYDWAGTAYPTPGALGSATGQGSHDLVGDPKFGSDGSSAQYSLGAASPALDSADPTAPGAADTDADGNRAADDPQTPNTGPGGTFLDRGAVERQGVILRNLGLVGGPAPYPVKATATTRIVTNWPLAVSYSTDFGDGSAPVVSAGTVAEHTYTKAGRFTVTTTATGPDGYRAAVSNDNPVVVNEPGPPVPVFTVKPCAGNAPGCGAPLSYVVDTTGTSSPWPITGYTVDYGDGSPVGTDPASPHVYPTPGDYSVTVTVTDQGGQRASLTRPVKVGYLPSRYEDWTQTRILDTRSGSSPVKLLPGGQLSVDLQLGDGLTAVVLNVTAVNPGGAGHLSVGPSGSARPSSSNVNYLAGRAIPNLVTVPVGPDGKVTVWNSPGGAALDVVVDRLGAYFTGFGNLYNPVSPTRILDTRTGVGRPAGRVHSTCVYNWNPPPVTLKVRGANGVPANATSVVLNVTVTDPDQDGNLSVGGNGSNLNFLKGETVSNQVIAPVAADGTVTLCNNAGTLHMIADLSGYYAPDSGSAFTPVLPSRALDTRLTTAGPLGADATLAVPSGAPAGATAAVLNVTSTDSDQDSFLTVWADGAARPGTSSVNFTRGRTVPNHVVTPLGTDGRFDVYNHVGSTQVIADVFGYFSKP